MLHTLNQVLAKQRKLAVGLMSGTSLDGIDAALVEIAHTDTDTEVQLLAFETLPYTAEEREALLRLCHPSTSSVDHICNWNVKLGRKFAQAAKAVMKSGGVDKSKVDFISSHGQTIYHSPDEQATMQIGELAVIAEETGVLTVGDFRPSDMAVGGQGAPLVPFVDYLLFASEEKGRVLLNIGGIANLTVIQQKAKPEDVLAFDTGPGNVLIDAIVHKATDGKHSFDQAGQLACKGRVVREWLEQIMREDEYLTKSLPKSTGREYYTIMKAEAFYREGLQRGLSLEDILATITAYTSHSISQQIRTLIDPYYAIDEIIVSGGGAHNHFLMQELQKTTKQRVVKMEDIQFSSDAKEAITFVILGNQFLHGLPNQLPSATGAKKSVSMGKLAFPHVEGGRL